MMAGSDVAALTNVDRVPQNTEKTPEDEDARPFKSRGCEDDNEEPLCQIKSLVGENQIQKPLSVPCLW
jgi:hypothetical protein